MNLACPDCHRDLDVATLHCPNGHRFSRVNGVLVLLAGGLRDRLERYLPVIEAARAAAGKRLLDASAYERLPWVAPGGDRQLRLEWRLRRHDLALVERLLEHRPRRRALDIGAWNAWLANRLAVDGHEVTAIDYFVDEHDGLGARRHYRSAWEAIQLDLDDLTVLRDRWDVVIVNRCLQFFPDPAAYVRGALALVAPGGLLVLTGLQVFRNPAAKAARVAVERAEFRRRHGIDLLLRPAKGYLDGDDVRGLRELGFTIAPYRGLRLANLRSRFQRSRPWHGYGVCNAPGEP